MKKNVIIFSLLFLATMLLPSCFRSSENTAFYMDSNAMEESFFGVVESFSTGIITENEPLKVRFCSGVTMKKQMGEDLPTSTFTIEPKIKGKPFWIDSQTIGFQFDNVPDKQKMYRVTFDLSVFIETPKELKPLQFSFMIRKQNFEVTETAYVCKDMNTCSYELLLTFANTVDPKVVEEMIDKQTANDYQCEAKAVSSNQVKLVISNILRKKSTYNIDVKLKGDVLNVDKDIKKELIIPASSDFCVMDYSLNTTEKLIQLRFSNPLNSRQNFTGFINFSNEIPYKTDVDGNCLMIYCENSDLIKSNFDVVFLNGIKDENDRTLNSDYLIKDIVFNDLLPKVKWSEDGVIVPDAENTTVYFDAICLKSVTLRVIKIYDNNVLSFLQENDFEETYNVKRVGRLEKKIKLQLDNPNYNEWKTFPIKLSDYVEVKNGSMYQLSIDFDVQDYPFACEGEIEVAETNNEQSYWDGDSYDYRTYYYGDDWWEHENDPCYPSYYNYVEIKKNIFVSNLAITAKTAHEGVVDVFVRKISDAQSVKNCSVQLLDYQMQHVGEAVTDKEGFCKIAYTNKPYFIVAQSDDAGKSYLKLTNNQALSLSKFDVSGTSIANNINGFIYSNRNVWRPGDVLNINFMLADKLNQLPDNIPIIMELYDANGRLYQKLANNAPKGKIYAFEVKTNPSDATGIWAVEMKVGNQKFTKNLRVETVKPNRLKIDFKLPEQVSLLNNPEVKLSAQWLNGLKASNLSATIDVDLKIGTTKFKNFSQYSFSNISSDFYGTSTSLFSSKLDADGSKMVSFKSLKDLSAPGFLNAIFTTKVFEQSGDFSITSHQAIISPFQRYVGVAFPKTTSKYGSYYFTGEDWNFDVIVVNENETLPQTEVYLDCNVYKLDYYWWWDNDNNELGKYARGTYRKPVYSTSIKCRDGKGSFRLKFSDNEWGSYLIVIEDPTFGHIFSKVVNFDTPYYSYRTTGVGDAPALISLKSDKTAYKVGEKMHISFPANKNAKALITVESASNIIQTMVLESLSEDAVVNITATKEMVPNVYVYVSMIQPYNNENGLPLRMYGVIPITIEDENALLNPNISLPTTTESNKEVTIKVSENNGKEMFYTLALVDEGILGLTNYKTPDPYRHFFSKQALNIRTWDNYHQIIDAFTGELNSVYAVGGDLSIVNQESMLSERFSAVAMMLGPFKLEKGKTASHTLKIPEYIGSLRAMVVATDGKGAYGSSQKNMTVKDQIMIIPTAPRIISPKDKFFIPLQILAPDLKNKEVVINISTENLTLLKQQKITTKINDDGEATVELEVAVPETTGAAKIEITATSGTITAKTEINMPIRTPYAVSHQMITEEIAPKSTKEMNMNVAGMNGTLSGNLMVNTAIPINLFHRLNTLIDYPHGCLEQTVSKAFPQLYLDNLVGLEENTKSEMKQNIETVIITLKAHLRSDYSMTNWIGGSYVTPWTELYAAHFLIEAKAKGYNVENEMVKNIIKYQEAKAKAWRYNSDYPSDETIQAYRLFVLSLNNTAEVGAMNRFKSLTFKYPLTKALLASSYALVGKKKIAEEILPVIDVTSESMESDWFTSYGSKTRDLAMMTYAKMLTDGNSDYVKQYIDQICKVLGSNQYMSTQTTAFSLFVLGKYADMNGYKNAPISVITHINGKEKAINTNLSSGTYSFVPKIGNNTISVTNNTAAPIFTSVYTKSTVPEYETVEKGNGYKMSVQYFDKAGNLIDPKVLKRNTDFYVEIVVENPNPYKITDNALSYLIPSGWEIINDRLFSEKTSYSSQYNFMDLRDDRVYFYFDLSPNDKKHFKISLNATYSGSFTIPSVHCEDMYNNEIYYIIPAKAVEVQ